jgi:hypothetical protein
VSLATLIHQVQGLERAGVQLSALGPLGVERAGGVRSPQSENSYADNPLLVQPVAYDQEDVSGGAREDVCVGRDAQLGGAVHTRHLGE